MTLRRVDASDSTDFDSWFDVLRRSEDLRGVGQGWHPDEWRARALVLDAPKTYHLLSDTDADGTVLAVAIAEVTRDDNLHWLRAQLHVDPDRRRRGHGSRAVAALEHYARSLQRRRLVIGVIEGPREIGVAPHRAFAPRMGYEITDEAARRDIAWPRPNGEMDELEARWRPHAPAYEILSWVGPTPDRWLSDRASLLSVMPTEAPHANHDVDAEQWDAHRVRLQERTTDEMGREFMVSVALDRASGRLVGYSELTVSRDFTETAYQWDTLVLGAHRGHRLGGLLKLANMRQLESLHLDVRRISTFNSVHNAPMIAVNEQLGARLAGAHVDWLKDLEV